MASQEKSGGFIDLGEPIEMSGCCSPAESVVEKKVHYPNLYICSKKQLDLGDSGECLIRYKLRASGDRKQDDNEREYTYDLEVESIKPTEKSKEEDSDEQMQGEPKSRSGFRKSIGLGGDEKAKKTDY